MQKMNLGNDFSEEEGGGDSSTEEAEETKSSEEEGDENENSTDNANSENNEENSDDEEEEGSDDEGEEPEKTDEEKQRELQGLLDTEKSLDTDGATLDEKIAAARTRIAQKRGDRRVKRDLVETIETTIPPEEETDDLSDVDPDTLKLLERFTKAKGLVPASELKNMTYAEAHKASEGAFFEAHPEYKPENDADDTLYLALKEELKNYSKPADPKKISELFEKAHREVARLYPDKFKTQSSTEKKVEKKPVDGKTKAASVRLKNQGLGGGSGGSKGGGSKGGADTAKKELSSEQITALRDGGWSEDDIKRLTGK